VTQVGLEEGPLAAEDGCVPSCGPGGGASAGLGLAAQKNGKASRVALIAVARQLLVIANAVIRDGRVWDPKLAIAA
jgi:hypothetical protein